MFLALACLASRPPSRGLGQRMSHSSPPGGVFCRSLPPQSRPQWEDTAWGENQRKGRGELPPVKRHGLRAVSGLTPAAQCIARHLSGAVRPSGPLRAQRAAHLQCLSGGVSCCQGSPGLVPGWLPVSLQSRIGAQERRRAVGREGGRAHPLRRCMSWSTVGRGGQRSSPAARHSASPLQAPQSVSGEQATATRLSPTARSAVSAALRHLAHGWPRPCGA
ncbi:hypothetical protein NDU88_004676 [Pleurodeles waltl]|uniref:Uncharacterized protein n=1 Tax=Pleurodeles waltl TaxID=8319 RepID=A0AAV7PKH9_PLEWA|nr:hypothetical protein NDU88_004676 [Pleurodeles waltl]